ncbi:MAG: ABC transporter permease, partial [Gemmatimonadales bacterium]
MPFTEAIRLALQAIWHSKLRSFFTLLGIIVSVGFLVVVVAVIQGMNAYVKENLTGAMIGTNAFQVRRTPISVGLLDEEQVKAIQKRPIITATDAETVRRAVPDAQAVSLQSGWPTPVSDVSYRNRTVGNVLVFGVTPPYQIVQDYRFLAGDPLSDIDVRGRRPVAVLGYDVADKLFVQPSSGIGLNIWVEGRVLKVF